MMFLRRGPTGRARRPGILTEGCVARGVRAYRAGTGRGRITDDGGNLAVAVRFDCAISSGLLNFGSDIVIVRNSSITVPWESRWPGISFLPDWSVLPRHITSHTGTALFWRFDFQSPANRVCTMFHDEKTQPGYVLRLALKSDAIVGHAQDTSVLPAAYLNHYSAGLCMFVSVDHRFARDEIKL